MSREEDNEVMVYNAMINSYNVIVEERFDKGMSGSIQKRFSIPEFTVPIG